MAKKSTKKPKPKEAKDLRADFWKDGAYDKVRQTLLAALWRLDAATEAGLKKELIKELSEDEIKKYYPLVLDDLCSVNVIESITEKNKVTYRIFYRQDKPDD
jgi:hypothetical protein